MNEGDTFALESLLARAADAEEFARWVSRARQARWCTHPVRLAGRTVKVDPMTGAVEALFSSETEADGVLLKACGQRRQTACEPCSVVYRGDAWHLIAAGLRGGKGVPRDVAAHPIVFLTLTAPTFGLVHSRREQGGQPRACRPRGQGCCPHGCRRQCVVVHGPEDEALGDPLCPGCFDYPKAVLWNALAGELWRRTTIGAWRELAAVAGSSPRQLATVARLSFAKVVEYQRRGVVHFHAVVRLDGAGDNCPPPPVHLDSGILQAALLRAAPKVAVSYPATAGVHGQARWGLELHVAVMGKGTVSGAVAAYIAKYSTKSTDPLGQLDHRLKESDLGHLDVRPHLARMVKAAWELGGRRELADLRLRHWAHTLGFRGHWLTKSRRYSTTFAALRSARETWREAGRTGTAGKNNEVVVKEWQFRGRGWTSRGDAWLAETGRRNAAEDRRLAREAREDRKRQDKASDDG